MIEYSAGIESRIRQKVPLAPFTTFRIGGPAQFFIEPETLVQLKGAVEWALKRNLPCFLLGGGANVLVHDDGYRGLIIQTGKLDGISVEENTIWAECGLLIDALVEVSCVNGLSGLEFAAGLPGTVGGALFMNARAYGGEFSQVVQSVHALRTCNGEVVEEHLAGGKLRFSYKKSIFQERNFYIYTALFKLGREKETVIRDRIDDVRRKREDAGQFVFPNAGCIFKNNYEAGKPTGMIIDELGLKGKRIGGAEVYERHGNFIINRGMATARDVYRLMRFIEDEVYSRTGIRLEREITLVGKW